VSRTSFTDRTPQQRLKRRVATPPDNKQRCMIGLTEQDRCSVSSHNYVIRWTLAVFEQGVGDDLSKLPVRLFQEFFLEWHTY
jgi:hypothetical protein